MEFSILIFLSAYMKKIICICLKKIKGWEEGEKGEKVEQV